MKSQTRHAPLHKLVIPMLLPLFAHAAVAAAEPESVFPGKSWQRRSPAAVGMDEAKLAEFQKLAGGSGCVTRYGYLVYSWGTYDQPRDVASAIKPFYSFLLLKAVEEGRLASVDQPVMNYRPELKKLNAGLGHKDRQLTFRHLANQTACLGYQDRPGTAFDYNDATMGFFWDTLVNHVYGTPWAMAESAVIAPRLSEPLGFQDGTPGVVQGRKNGRFAVSSRDFCRFGLLFLHQGSWDGKQVLRPDLAKMAISEPLPLSIQRTSEQRAETCEPVRSIGGGGNQCDHNGGYSWLWWLNRPARDGQLWFADAPPDQFMALGHWGKRGMAVLPSLQLVVSWNDAQELHRREIGNRAFGTLCEAVVGPK